jgi:hypothetical protein
MGANAQTAVPAFTAGQVLTAAEMTQINTGIPVFATTTTRDEEFGGAGEKVLAQGQYAYIEATSALMVYTGSTWINASISATTNTVATSQTTTSATFTDLATVGPTVTVTTGTSALVILSAAIESSNGNRCYGGFAVSGATTIAAATTSALASGSGGGFIAVQSSWAIPVTLTAGSNTFTMKYASPSSGTTLTALNRTITVIPL